MGQLELDCIDSWKSNLRDYKLRIWTEDSLDLRQFPFAWQAFQTGKYAFVSDVVRLYALYQEGGIYLDTDMLLLKNFDVLLVEDFFTAEYRPSNLNAAVIGSKPGHPLLNTLLDVYKNLEFDFLRPKTIPDVFDKIVWSFPDKSVKIYPPDFFYPLPLEKKGEDFTKYLTENSFAVHLWNHSWKDEFVLLREDRFWDSFQLSIKHVFSYPDMYRNRNYLKRYSSQFQKHFKRYLKTKWDGKT